MAETATLCNLMLYQDDGRIRCALVVGHDGAHKSQEMLDWKPRLIVKPHNRKVERYEDDPKHREVSNGNGIYFAVPLWVAEALERDERARNG